MELASQKKEISFKGRGTSVCVAFEGAILPGIPDVLRELRDAGGMVTGHQIVFDFKKLQVPRNWLLDLLRDVIFPMSHGAAGNSQDRLDSSARRTGAAA
mgnify:CR=1 FL=1